MLLLIIAIIIFYYELYLLDIVQMANNISKYNK